METDKCLFIFDLGEVVLRNIKTLPMMSEMYNLDYVAFRKDYAFFDKPLMEGYMEPSWYYRHMEDVFNTPKITEDLFAVCFNPYPNENILSWVKCLKENGHRVVIGSNTFKPHWDYVLKMKENPLCLFDSLYASHLIHIAKPAKAFWNYIMDKEGFKAENTVFVDDRLDNISAAESLGITPYHYQWNDEESREFFSKYVK